MFLSFDSDLNLKWKKDLGGRVSGSPTEDKDGNIYAAAFVTEKQFNEQNEYVSDKYIYRLFSFDFDPDKSSDDNLRWQKDLDSGIAKPGQGRIFSPSVGESAGYISAENNLYSFDLETGEIQWTYSIKKEDDKNYYGGSPSLANDGTVYAVFSDGYLYALSSDGTEKWRHEIASNLSYWINYYYFSTAAIGADGAVYIGGENTFYALNSDGTEKWKYQNSDWVNSSVLVYAGTPAIAKDGALYVSFGGIYAASLSISGALYAFGL